MPDDERDARLSALEELVGRSDIRLDRHDLVLAELQRLASTTIDTLPKVHAHERSVQALHLDMRDLKGEVSEGFSEMRSGFDEMRAGFAITGAALVMLAERMDANEVDLRAFQIEMGEFKAETRSGLDDVRARLDRLEPETGQA